MQTDGYARAVPSQPRGGCSASTRKRFPRVGTATAIIASAITVSAAQAGVRTVALTDDIAPGTAFNFIGFDPPVINTNGDVAFAASLDTFEETDPTGGVWSEGSGSLAKVALDTEVAPGTTGVHFDPFESFGGLALFLDNSGRSAFGKELEFTTTSNYGVFSEATAGGVLQKVAVTGDSAVGANGADRVYSSISLGGYNNNGHAAFRAFMPPAAVPENFPSSGIWSEVTGSLGKVTERADPAPGTAGVFDSFDLPATNDSGVVAFAGDIGPGTSTTDGVWVYTLAKTTLTRLVGEGDAAPGGGTFSILFGPAVALNENGDLAFSATLVGGNEGVWVARNSTIERVALETEVAPGAGGATFDDIEEQALGLDEAGHAAFTATLSDGRRGLFMETSGGLEAVVVGSFGSGTPGDVAPDSGGATFVNVVRWATGENEQAAFLGDLSDFTFALFARDSGGTLHRIVGQDDLLEVAPSDSRLVFEPTLRGTDDGPGTTGINGGGLIAFSVEFDDGSVGVFVDDSLAVGTDGDFDFDGDLDLRDYADFQLCFGGAGNPPGAACPLGVDADFDNDTDVDLTDYDTFYLNFTGPL